jgi:hypothetical protein
MANVMTQNKKRFASQLFTAGQQSSRATDALQFNVINGMARELATPKQAAATHVD